MLFCNVVPTVKTTAENEAGKFAKKKMFTKKTKRKNSKKITLNRLQTIGFKFLWPALGTPGFLWPPAEFLPRTKSSKT